MVKRREDVRIEEKNGLMKGNNTAFTCYLLEMPQFTGAGRLYNRIVLPPYASIGYHQHVNDSEAYYVMSGSGLFNDNGTELTVNEGDLMFTPDGSWHGLINNTDKDLVILACVLFNFTKDKDLSVFRKVKKAGTRPYAETKNAFEGKNSIFADKLLEGEEFAEAGRLYNVVTFPKDSSIGYHTHTNESETYYVLKGNGIFNDDGVKTKVGVGDVMYTGPGHSHGLECDGDEDLVIAALIIFDKNI